MSAVSFDPRGPTAIRAFLATVGWPVQRASPDQMQPWFEPGVTVVVDESIYNYFRDFGSRRRIGEGWFVVGEGVGPYRLFWQSETMFHGRELTNQEVHRFGELTGVTLVAWTQIK